MARPGVQSTFPQPGQSHPAAAGRLARTLGLMKTPVPLIEASVTMLPALAGPRVLASREYSPHIVIGPASQRLAVVAAGNRLTEKYLGVVFWSGADKIEPGQTVIVKLALIYYPDSEDYYSAVLPSAEFTVREGGKVVGYGRVLRRDEWTEITECSASHSLERPHE